MKSGMQSDLADHLHGFRYQGLKGRYYWAPARRARYQKHLIVMVYGHHASLERNRGVLQYLRRFGQVLIFDLPGFGGMESFYKIGKKPNLDNYAHFLHDFLRQKLATGQRFTLIGMSLGFIMITRLLVLYPEWLKRIPTLISLVGFLDSKQLKLKWLRYWIYRFSARLVMTRLGAFIFATGS